MGAQDVGKFPVQTDGRGRVPAGGKAVHAGDHGTRGVLRTDRHADVVHPVVEHGLTARLHRPHAVAFIAVIPRGDGRMIFEVADEKFDEPRLPHDGFGIGEDVAFFKNRRHELAAAHPARDDADDEFDPVTCAHVAERSEPVHHHRIDARLVRQRLIVAETVTPIGATGITIARQGLKIAPKGKDAHHGDAMRR